MYNVIIPLIFGILFGFYFQNKKVRIPNKTGFWTIIVLIFSLGFSIGSNHETLRVLPQVGFNAIILALFTMLFSASLVKIGVKVVDLHD